MSAASNAAGPFLRPAGGVGSASNWRDGAACLGEDPELFFPVATTGSGFWQAEEAKTVPRRCPVLASCLTWALENGVEHGVWGGHTEGERRALRRRRARGTIRPT